MKIKSNDLLNKLTNLSKGLNKALIDTGDSFIFNENGIMVTTGDIVVGTPFENIGTFTIKGDTLVKFLSKCKDTEFDITFDKDNNVLKLADDNKVAEFSINLDLGFTANTYMPEDLDSFINVSEDFEKGLYYTAGTALKTTTCDSHKVLMFIHINKGYIEASDAHRFARYNLTQTNIDGEYLVKADKFLQLAPKGITGFTTYKNYIFFKTQDDTLYGIPTVDNTYLPTERIIELTNEENTSKIVFDDSFSDTLARFMTVTDGSHNPMATLSNGQAVITYESANIKFKEKVRADYSGEEKKFNFNPVTLKQALLGTTCRIGNNVIRFDSDEKTYILYLAD